MFEHYSKPLIPKADYHRRLVGAAGLALLLIAVSLGVGMVGYHAIEGMPWIDAYLSAAMILSGMGPVGEPLSTAGKLFAGTAYILGCLNFTIARCIDKPIII